MCCDTGQPGAAIRPRCATIRHWGLRYVRHGEQGCARHSARMPAAIRPARPATWPVRLATRPGLATILTGEGATTRPSERHDTAACARSLGQGVHLVHPTQF